MSADKHHVIISPGLDGRIWGLQLVTWHWPMKYQLYPDVIQTIWKDTRYLKPKLRYIIDRIDTHIKQGHRVSLIGTSASGSLVLNAFLERVSFVHRVVNIGGFVRKGHGKGLHNFDTRSAQSPSFYQSVVRFEKRESLLGKKDQKILTVHPLFGDELVPKDTVTIEGAINKTVPTGEHIVSIGAALLLYDPVIRFLKEE